MGRLPRFERLTDCPPPREAAAALARRPRAFFLDSAMSIGAMGRYSFAGCDPAAVFTAQGRELTLRSRNGTRRWRGDPIDALDELLARRRIASAGYPVPFTGGAVGFLSYDLGRAIERLPELAGAGLGEPDIWLGFYDELVAYDLHDGEAYLVLNGDNDGSALRAALHDDSGLSTVPCEDSEPVSNFTPEAYAAAIEEIKRLIAAGYVYQVNLSQRFEAPWSAPPWTLYERARDLNPAPMAAYLDCGPLAVVSASPERFLRRSGDVIETRPIKGTRPRGAAPEADDALAAELAASPKDRAEHIMIVDLERNDLGRVAQVGSVSVDEMMALERFPSVHHLTSTVRAVARPDATPGAILRAAFPGGSITGAPKIKAMEIIERLEPTRRGVYTGAIGYFADTGDFDLSIAIRTIVARDGRAYLQVGGGIVADSDPAAEYQETLDKGRALFDALGSGTPAEEPAETVLRSPGLNGRPIAVPDAARGVPTS